MNLGTLRLNTGLMLPHMGVAVSRASSHQTYASVSRSLRAGYRHIDLSINGAMLSAVGKAVRASGVPRNELFVTMKTGDRTALAEAVKNDYSRSVKILNSGPPDLLLLAHSAGQDSSAMWPVLERLYSNGEVRALGILNFCSAELERLLDIAKVVPAVCQISVSPRSPQHALRRLCASQDIVVETNGLFSHSGLRNHSVVTEIATDIGKPVPQILLRWGLQSGMGVLSKAIDPEFATNILTTSSFELTADQMHQVDQLDECHTAYQIKYSDLEEHSKWPPTFTACTSPWNIIESAQ